MLDSLVMEPANPLSNEEASGRGLTDRTKDRRALAGSPRPPAIEPGGALHAATRLPTGMKKAPTSDDGRLRALVIGLSNPAPDFAGAGAVIRCPDVDVNKGRGMEYDEREADLSESRVLQKLELGPALYLTVSAAFCTWMPNVSGFLAAGAAIVIWLARKKAKEIGHLAYMEELAMKRQHAARKIAEERLETLAAEHAELRRFALSAYWLIRRAEVLVYERQDSETIPISYPEFPIEPPESIPAEFDDDEDRTLFAGKLDAWASAQPRAD